MECLVTLSGVDGQKICSEGQVEFIGEKTVINYTIGGDNCRLEITGKRARQTRRGDVVLEIPFAEGLQTLARLGEGGLSGNFPVFTESIALTKTLSGIAVRLKYVLFGDKINLSLDVEYK